MVCPLAFSWELQTATIDAEFRCLEVRTRNELGVHSGDVMPVVPIESDREILVIGIPHRKVPWLPLHLVPLSLDFELLSADGKMTDVSIVALHISAGHALAISEGSSLWSADGRWPRAWELVRAWVRSPKRIDSRDIINFPTAFCNVSAPWSHDALSPRALDQTFLGGLGKGHWAGLLTVPYPISESGICLETVHGEIEGTEAVRNHVVRSQEMVHMASSSSGSSSMAQHPYVLNRVLPSQTLSRKRRRM